MRWITGIALVACGSSGTPTKSTVPPEDDGSSPNLQAWTPTTLADSGSSADSATTTPGSCGLPVLQTVPASGDADVYYRSAVRFTLASPLASATVTVQDDAGTVVPGTTTIAGALVSWVGDPLLPSTHYFAHLEPATCTIDFTTSSTGAPVDPTAIVGVSYGLALGEAQWVEPAGVGPLFAAQVGNFQALLGVRSADPDLTVALGAGALDEQERCSPTATITATAWENPWFQLYIDEWNLEAAGYTVPVSGVTVTGAFAPDGSRLQGVTASASLDTRPLGEAFGLGADPAAPCQLIAAFGVSCLECADGTGRYCVDVYLDDLDGPQIPGLTVVDRTETDVASDPTCP